MRQERIKGRVNEAAAELGGDGKLVADRGRRPASDTAPGDLGLPRPRIWPYSWLIFSIAIENMHMSHIIRSGCVSKKKARLPGASLCQQKEKKALRSEKACFLFADTSWPRSRLRAGKQEK